MRDILTIHASNSQVSPILTEGSSNVYKISELQRLKTKQNHLDHKRRSSFQASYIFTNSSNFLSDGKNCNN